jgi:hypothetical protein
VIDITAHSQIDLERQRKKINSKLSSSEKEQGEQFLTQSRGPSPIGFYGRQEELERVKKYPGKMEDSLMRPSSIMEEEELAVLI